MKIIVGLGNPGREYEETRHNIGFVVADVLAEKWGWAFRSKFQGDFADGICQMEKVGLLKPYTFMNLSGRSVRELVNFYKVALEDLLVIHDDLDLPLGKTRLRAQGSPGGHNGLRSIIGELGGDHFWRLKIGVGRPPQGWKTADYVLSAFPREEWQVLDDVIGKAGKIVDLWLEGETNKAMNLYN